MYVWIWRQLPGNAFAKALGCLVLFVGVVALLFFLVFPWAEKRLPWNDVTINQGPSPSSTSSPTAPVSGSATP